MITDNCYVLNNGECISPLECGHGDGIPIDEFVEHVESEFSTVDALVWMATVAVEFQTRLIKSEK